MPDKCRHIKGLIGQELARYYLKNCRGIGDDCLSEEARVDGCHGSAKIDFIIKDGEQYRPVEVKMQEYDLDSFGTAFECIVNKLADGNEIQGDFKGKSVPLSSPILVTWYPPAEKSLDDIINRYKKAGVEVISFADVMESLSGSGNKTVSEDIAKDIKCRVKEFLNEPNRFHLGERYVYSGRMKDFLKHCNEGQ